MKASHLWLEGFLPPISPCIAIPVSKPPWLSGWWWHVEMTADGEGLCRPWQGIRQQSWGLVMMIGNRGTAQNSQATVGPGWCSWWAEAGLQILLLPDSYKVLYNWNVLSYLLLHSSTLWMASVIPTSLVRKIRFHVSGLPQSHSCEWRCRDYVISSFFPRIFFPWESSSF